jgi:hypothetical protein
MSYRNKLSYILLWIGMLFVWSGCTSTVHVFYYKVPDNPQIKADVRDCQRTSLMSDINQWSIMGSCLNTVQDAGWYYGPLREKNCYNARKDGDAVGWILYDCYMPDKDMEKIKGNGSDWNNQGLSLYNEMLNAIKSTNEQKTLKTKSK